jgi:hypothetical protein
MATSRLRPRIIQNINDPNWFLSANANGDFNTISSDQSGYGALPSAEKNGTYVVYFESVGNTTPEIINQTGYFTKYIIDELGNIREIAPDSIALSDLKNLFPVGSSIIVESQDATQALANLAGEHTVTDIGTIQPLLITETGSNPNSYITTMSFAQVGSIILSGDPPPDYTLLLRKPNTDSPIDPAIINTTRYIGNNSVNFRYNPISSNPLGYWQPTYTGTYGAYVFGTNTGDYDTTVSFEFKAEFSKFNNTIVYNLIDSSVTIAIELSTDNGSNWTMLPSTNISTTNGVTPRDPGQVIPDGGLTYELTSVVTSTYMGVKSNPRQFNNGDLVRFKMYFSQDTSALSNIKFYGETSQWSSIKAVSNYSGELQTTSSYWDGATYPTDGTPQYLTASLGLTSFINNDMVQITPTASLSMSFSPIILPANIQPGDNIRFEYDINKVAKIYEIGTLTDGRTTLKISPAVPAGSKLDHFVVYRTVDDGNYITLNVKKEYPGQITGFLKPKYMSKSLTDKLPDIISNLKKDGTIPS